MEQEGLERYVSRCKFLKIVDCDFEVSELMVISLRKRNGVMDGSFCYSLYAVVVMFSLLNYSYGWFTYSHASLSVLPSFATSM